VDSNEHCGILLAFAEDELGKLNDHCLIIVFYQIEAIKKEKGKGGRGTFKLTLYIVTQLLFHS